MCAMKKYLAEFLGTFVLVVFACGTAIATGCGTEYAVDGAWLMTALSFGLVIVAMAYSIGNVSGCHINPAVSIAMLVSKKLSVKDFIGYVVAQFAGGLAGAGVLAIYANPDTTPFATNGIITNVSRYANTGIAVTILAEVILTFVFVFAILGVTSKASNGAVSGIVIGLTLTLVHIIGIELTGTSVNPARSFGVALLAGGEALSNVWIFIVAPLVGGVLAALVWKFFSCKEEQ